MGPFYYHYTDKTSLDRILKSGYIKASTDTTLDCAFGKGVYLTTLKPEEHSKEVIAKNNYEHGWKGGLANGKTDSYIKICIRNGTLKLKKVTDPNCPSRDVYLYADDLYLHDFHYTYGHVQSGKALMLCSATAGATVGGMIGGPVGAGVGAGVGAVIGYLFC